jgi:hypothetical protein
VKKLRLDDKGVGSAELLFATMIFIIVIGGMVNLVGTELTGNQTAELSEVRMIGETIAEAINTAFINVQSNSTGNSTGNYSVNLTMPNNPNFTAIIGSNGSLSTLTMNYKGNSTVIQLIPPNVTNFNMTPGNRYQVKATNNTVTFTKL